MKKIKIGLPKGLMYYENYVLWKNYFEHLNCKIIQNKETTKEIIELGTKNTNNGSCIPYQIYLGHILSLTENIDYILIPKIYNYRKNTYTCPLYQTIYDHITQFIPSSQIITYCIDYHNYKYEFFELFKIGLLFTKNPIKIIYSYLISKKKQRNSIISKQNEQKNKLSKEGPKVLIIAKKYILNEDYLIDSINNILTENNIISINSCNLDSKTALLFSSYFSNYIKITDIQKNMGALYYYKYQIDGIIYLTSNNCPLDSIINDIAIYKNNQLPYIKLSLNSDLNPEMTSFINNVKDYYNKK